jgi:AraC-like DNA-binding protein
MDHASPEGSLRGSDNPYGRLSILDLNPENEIESYRYPIQPYYTKGKALACLPAIRYRHLIAYYYQIYGLDRNSDRTIYPTGNTALVFRCDPQNPGAVFVGTPTAPTCAGYADSDCPYFVILFWPGMGYAFSPFPPVKLIDQYVPLEQILPAGSGRIIEKIVLAQSYQARVRIFERFLEKRLSFAENIPTGIAPLIKTVYRDSAGGGVGKLTDRACYSDRHVRRLFLKYVGISPKLLGDMIRHQKSLRYLNLNPARNMAGLAYDQGYSDQSHFIRHFKKFQGITPSQFISRLTPRKSMPTNY